MSGYLGFERTGHKEVDAIIETIENAGDAYHHTSEWADDEYGESYISRINNKIIEAAEALNVHKEWKPIETAPKDRKARLVFCPENKCIFCVSFDDRDGTWMYFGGGGTLFHEPTHWMPLPEAPN